jgi:hypothetical protein
MHVKVIAKRGCWYFYVEKLVTPVCVQCVVNISKGPTEYYDNFSHLMRNYDLFKKELLIVRTKKYNDNFSTACGPLLFPNVQVGVFDCPVHVFISFLTLYTGVSELLIVQQTISCCLWPSFIRRVVFLVSGGVYSYLIGGLKSFALRLHDLRSASPYLKLFPGWRRSTQKCSGIRHGSSTVLIILREELGVRLSWQ